MNLGSKIIYIVCFIVFFKSIFPAYSDEKIKSVPLINLEDLSPTFEEEKDELEKIDSKNNINEDIQTNEEASFSTKNDKIYINLRALNKITAKTSEIRMTTGEKKYFGSLEIKALKCQASQDKDVSDTVAYLQVKDLSSKDNNQVFLFNGWSFVSSPTLKSIDHPIYDLWVTSCENI
tara:strand:+ start:135 stop:665 length:531 start_codon:yes stop_codon:yes gene_type:complete